MPTLRQRLTAPALRDELEEFLATVMYMRPAPPNAATDVLELLEQHLLAGEPRRLFTPHHLGIVYLLAEQQGATHTRLRRLWDARSARKVAPWPWISDSGIRTRTAELVAWGIVEDTGARGTSATGRPSKIWTLVGIDPVALGRDVAPVPGVDDGVPARLRELLEEARGDSTIVAHLMVAAEVAGVSR